MDYKYFVSERIIKLRQAKGASARDMSNRINQNQNYINHIENKKMEPSLSALFSICEYFEITPQEFFDVGNNNPERLNNFIEDVKCLDEKAFEYLAGFVKEMVEKKK